MKSNTKYQNISALGKYFRLSNNPPVFSYGDREFLFDENNKKYIDLACGNMGSYDNHILIITILVTRVIFFIT